MQKMYIAYDDMHVKQILVLVIILTRIRDNIFWFKLAMEKNSKYLYLFLIIDRRFLQPRLISELTFRFHF